MAIKCQTMLLAPEDLKQNLEEIFRYSDNSSWPKMTDIASREKGYNIVDALFSVFFHLIVYVCQVHPWSFTTSPWKWWVGRVRIPIGKIAFQRGSKSFPEGDLTFQVGEGEKPLFHLDDPPRNAATQRYPTTNFRTSDDAGEKHGVSLARPLTGNGWKMVETRRKICKPHIPAFFKWWKDKSFKVPFAAYTLTDPSHPAW